MLSAKYFAQSTVAFEEVALKFVERDERDALRSYLLAKVEKLRKGVSLCPNDDIACCLLRCVYNGN